jgi:hypothetical protein
MGLLTSLRKSAHWAWAMPLLLAATPGYASPWLVCRMEIKVTETVKRPFPELRATVLSVTPSKKGIACPSVGEVLSFTPESRDYQSTLPRRKWPQAGKVTKIRYMYLDGFCMNDGGPPSRPCRIEHYPVEW